jgi:SAM-dependent methyltransferase
MDMADADDSFLALRDGIRKNFLKYTRKAFGMLPPMVKPKILDAGCGSGVPTLELAALSRGEVVGLDIDPVPLRALRARIVKQGLQGRVAALCGSILAMPFAYESFDVVWAEGSVHVMGFERGLMEWRRLLRPGGFLVIHDEQVDLTKKLELIPRCGYGLLGHFLLGENVWRDEYFLPLEKLLDRWRDKREAGRESALDQARWEVGQFRQYPDRNCSAYFVSERIDP